MLHRAILLLTTFAALAAAASGIPGVPAGIPGIPGVPVAALQLGSAQAIPAVPSGDRFASQLVRSARAIIEQPELTAENLAAALDLLRLATTYAPDDVSIWHYALEVATIAEDEELKGLAIERLLKLDPANDVVRLLRINAALNRYQTVDERLAAYEGLLTGEQRRKLSPAVASRLAFDTALLHRRLGNVASFADWLGQAIELDPSNRTAVSIATGYYREQVDDPHAVAQLLVRLILADPTDLGVAAELAEMLLEHGAYDGAARLYELVARGRIVEYGMPSQTLLADWVIALWGKGDVDMALRIINERQQVADEQAWMRVREENPEVTTAQLSQVGGVLSPTLAVVRAAIHHRERHADQIRSLRRALRAFEQELGVMQQVAERTEREIGPVEGPTIAQIFDFGGALESDEQSPPAEAPQIEAEDDAERRELREWRQRLPQEVAQRALEVASMLLWFEGEPAGAARLIEHANRLMPLSETARQRFDGWLAYRRDDLDIALEKLQPIAETDSAARLGLALTYQARGEKRQAAEALLAVARAQPGAAMGVWAADLLLDMIGVRVPISDDAKRFNALAEEIPGVVQRFPTEPSRALAIRLTPTKGVFAPLEPIRIKVELINNSPFPLAIDPSGPIRPNVLIMPSLSVANAPRIPPVRPMVVSIAHRLRLAPRESITLTLDMRDFAIGQQIETFLLRGSLLRVNAISNFIATGEGITMPGLLGVEIESPPIRIDGMRLDREALSDTIELVKRRPPEAALDDMILLTEVRGTALASGLDAPEDVATLEEIQSLVAQRYQDLSPLSQALMISIIMPGDLNRTILDMAQRSEERPVKIAYLLFQTLDPSDPMLDAAEGDADAIVRSVGALVRRELQRQREQSGAQGSQRPAPSSAPPARTGEPR